MLQLQPVSHLQMLMVTITYARTARRRCWSGTLAVTMLIELCYGMKSSCVGRTE